MPEKWISQDGTIQLDSIKQVENYLAKLQLNTPAGEKPPDIKFKRVFYSRFDGI